MTETHLKFDRTGLKNLVRRLQTLSVTQIQYGFFEDKVYGEENDNLPVATVALMNENGDRSMNRPPRPFFSNQVGARTDSRQGGKVRFWIAAPLGKIAGECILKKGSWKGSMVDLGKLLVKELQIEIQEFDDPANSAYTIALKGFDDPLIDTGFMLESVDSRIVRKENGSTITTSTD